MQLLHRDKHEETNGIYQELCTQTSISSLGECEIQVADG